MREQHAAITAHGVAVAAIAPTDGAQLAAAAEAFGPFPFPLYGDPTGKTYNELGHRHMAKWELLGKAALALVTGKLKLAAGDPKQQAVAKQAMRTQDMYVQGGTWLFSPTGEVLWSHLDTEPSALPMAEIMEQVTVDPPSGGAALPILRG